MPGLCLGFPCKVCEKNMDLFGCIFTKVLQVHWTDKWKTTALEWTTWSSDLKVSSSKLSSLRAVMVHFGLRLPSPSYNWWVEEKKKCYMQHIYLFIDSELYFFGLFLRALLWNNWLLKDSVLRDYIHLIQLPVGFQWEQNWILMQQMGLKSSFPF